MAFVLNAGANVKEAQRLARHCNPSLTMNVYGRASKGRLAEISQRVGDAILSRANTTGTQRRIMKAATLCGARRKMVEAGGVEPPS